MVRLVVENFLQYLGPYYIVVVSVNQSVSETRRQGTVVLDIFELLVVFRIDVSLMKTYISLCILVFVLLKVKIPKVIIK